MILQELFYMCSYLYRIPQGDISLDELRGDNAIVHLGGRA